MVTEANNEATYEDFVPYLDTIFESFGVDRVMFGSDWPGKICIKKSVYDK